MATNRSQLLESPPVAAEAKLEKELLKKALDKNDLATIKSLISKNPALINEKIARHSPLYYFILCCGAIANHDMTMGGIYYALQTINFFLMQPQVQLVTPEDGNLVHFLLRSNIPPDTKQWILRALLKSPKGKEVNELLHKQDQEGRTTLHVAIQHLAVACAKKLLHRKHVQWSTPDKKGQHAFAILGQVEFIKEHEDKVKKVLVLLQFFLQSAKQEDVVKLFLTRDKNTHKTPLHHYLNQGLLQCVEVVMPSLFEEITNNFHQYQDLMHDAARCMLYIFNKNPNGRHNILLRDKNVILLNYLFSLFKNWNLEDKAITSELPDHSPVLQLIGDMIPGSDEKKLFRKNTNDLYSVFRFVRYPANILLLEQEEKLKQRQTISLSPEQEAQFREECKDLQHIFLSREPLMFACKNKQEAKALAEKFPNHIYFTDYQDLESVCSITVFKGLSGEQTKLLQNLQALIDEFNQKMQEIRKVNLPEPQNSQEHGEVMTVEELKTCVAPVKFLSLKWFTPFQTIHRYDELELDHYQKKLIQEAQVTVDQYQSRLITEWTRVMDLCQNKVMQEQTLQFPNQLSRDRYLKRCQVPKDEYWLLSPEYSDKTIELTVYPKSSPDRRLDKISSKTKAFIAKNQLGYDLNYRFMTPRPQKTSKANLEKKDVAESTQSMTPKPSNAPKTNLEKKDLAESTQSTTPKSENAPKTNLENKDLPPSTQSDFDNYLQKFPKKTHTFGNIPVEFYDLTSADDYEFIVNTIDMSPEHLKELHTGDFSHLQLLPTVSCSYINKDTRAFAGGHHLPIMFPMYVALSVPSEAIVYTAPIDIHAPYQCDALTRLDYYNQLMYLRHRMDLLQSYYQMNSLAEDKTRTLPSSPFAVKPVLAKHPFYKMPALKSGKGSIPLMTKDGLFRETCRPTTKDDSYSEIIIQGNRLNSPKAQVHCHALIAEKRFIEKFMETKPAEYTQEMIDCLKLLSTLTKDTKGRIKLILIDTNVRAYKNKHSLLKQLRHIYHQRTLLQEKIMFMERCRLADDKRVTQASITDELLKLEMLGKKQQELEQLANKPPKVTGVFFSAKKLGQEVQKNIVQKNLATQTLA